MLKNKCVDISKFESDTKEVLIDTLSTVIQNLHNKALLYANLVALIAVENPNLAQEIFYAVFESSLKQCLIND